MHVSPSAPNILNMTINYIILTLRISRKIDQVLAFNNGTISMHYDISTIYHQYIHTVL